MRRFAVLSVASAVGFVVIACNNSTDPEPTADFLLDAPLCSSVLAIQMSIDNSVAGTDTFRVNLAPNHLRSRAFPLKAGAHTFDAHVVNNNGTTGFDFPTKTASLSAGGQYTDTLSFYCS